MEETINVEQNEANVTENENIDINEATEIKEEFDLKEELKKQLADEQSELYKIFIEKIEKEVSKRISGEVPKVNTNTYDANQLEEFKKMNYPKRLALAKSDPMLYDKLSKLSLDI